MLETMLAVCLGLSAGLTSVVLVPHTGFQGAPPQRPPQGNGVSLRTRPPENMLCSFHRSTTSFSGPRRLGRLYQGRATPLHIKRWTNKHQII